MASLKPDLAEGVEEAFVVVVGDAPSVLDLTEHVPDTRPNHALRRDTQTLRPVHTCDFLHIFVLSRFFCEKFYNWGQQ